MKRIVLLLFLIIQYSLSQAQLTGSFFVNGDADKFYPVVFIDGNWDNHVATELEIGRSSTHEDQQWSGTLMSRFRFHNTRWGNGARFIDAEINQKGNGISADVPFIAGYADATGNNSSFDLIIWLKGNATYHFKSNTNQVPRIYDGVQNALPFQEHDGPAHTFKTSVDATLNAKGQSIEGTAYFHGYGLNYMYGDLGLGTMDTRGYKLAVNGNIRAKEIKVETANWPDYVFEENYASPSLTEIENYIKVNKHLPEIPSAEEVKAANGVSLGEMNNKLLKKMEEMTLHMIEMNKRLNVLNDQVSEQKSQLIKQRNQINKIKAVKR